MLQELRQHYPWLLGVTPLAGLTPALAQCADRCVLLLPAQVEVLGAILGKTRLDLFPVPPDVIVYHLVGESLEVQPTRLATALGCNLLGTLQVPADPQAPCIGAQACSQALCSPTAAERQRDVKERLASLLQGDRTAIRRAAGGQTDTGRLADSEEELQQKLRRALDLRRRLLHYRELESSIQRHAQSIRQYVDNMLQPTRPQFEEFQRQSQALTELQQRLFDEQAVHSDMRSHYVELRQHLYAELALPEE